MSTLKEKLDEMARIKAELQRMETDDTVTEEDSGDLRDTYVDRWEQLDRETVPIIERMERVRGITRAGADPASREPGSDQGGGMRAPEFLQRHDPFEGLDAVRDYRVTRPDLVSRSLNAVEAHAKRGLLDDARAQEATLKAQQHPGIARHMLLHGSDEYLDAFRAYLDDPVGEGKRQAERALGIASGGVGGYLLPYILDPTIVISNAGAANPYRRMARVEQTTSNAWQGV
ncbi:MAG TPA: hypothetical protein VNE21_06895, partial [Mycobacteriales bacterium]|nr:hypothetical protein [Mycobacteriales bacterium]